jgi:uncharacterized membrane protein
MSLSSIWTLLGQYGGGGSGGSSGGGGGYSALYWVVVAVVAVVVLALVTWLVVRIRARGRGGSMIQPSSERSDRAA